MILSTVQRRGAWLLYYIFLAALLAANSFGYLDPDFGWHLKVGETIARERSVPSEQLYMWSLGEAHWVDHEWLSNLITYGLWSLGGYVAVSVFFILLPLISLALINRYVFNNYLHKTREQVAFACFGTAALFACLPHFGVRMQEFSFLFFSILLIIIDQYRRTLNLKNIYWLIPLLFVWACTHGSFLIGVATVLGWIFYELLFKRRKTNKYIFLIGALAIAATLATPYGLKLYSFLSDYGTNRYYLSHIEEWRSPYSHSIRYDQIIYTLISFTLMLGAWLFSKQRWPLWQFLILMALLAAATRSVRHFPLLAVGTLLFALPNPLSNLLNKTLPYSKMLNNLLIVCLFLASLGLVAQSKFTKNPFQSYCQNFPCGAVQFLRDKAEYSSLKLFNDYGWGGYLIAARPEQKVFIDGRLPQYPFAGHTMLEEYSEFFKIGNSEKKLDEYGIELIMFKSKEKPFEPDWIERFVLGKEYKTRFNPLIEFLKNSQRWKVIYSDETATLYARVN